MDPSSPIAALTLEKLKSFTCFILGHIDRDLKIEMYINGILVSRTFARSHDAPYMKFSADQIGNYTCILVRNGTIISSVTTSVIPGNSISPFSLPSYYLSGSTTCQVAVYKHARALQNK